MKNDNKKVIEAIMLLLTILISFIVTIYGLIELYSSGYNEDIVFRSIPYIYLVKKYWPIYLMNSIIIMVCKKDFEE